MKVQRNERRQGFTLAELMVVIVIIGLLATLVTTDVVGFLAGGKTTKARADINAIEQAVDVYYLRNGQWPDDLEILVQKDDLGNRYLDATVVPKDPWKNEYAYVRPEGGDDLDIISYGRDGQPGGEGEDADIHLIDMKGE